MSWLDEMYTLVRWVDGKPKSALIATLADCKERRALWKRAPQIYAGTISLRKTRDSDPSWLAEVIGTPDQETVPG